MLFAIDFLDEVSLDLIMDEFEETLVKIIKILTLSCPNLRYSYGLLGLLGSCGLN